MKNITATEPTSIKSIFAKLKEILNSLDYSYDDYQNDRMQRMELRIAGLEREIVNLRGVANKSRQNQ
ncbi:MAG: hypothetical protein P4L87_03250 [Formivibrio sp.]|nr:hypothetical protein [Formivibrio sp.]